MKKVLSVITLLGAMTLVACGGKGGETSGASSAKSAASKQSTSKSSKQSTLPPHVHAFTYGTPVETAGKSTYKTGTCSCGKKDICWAVNTTVDGSTEYTPAADGSVKLAATGDKLVYKVPATAAVSGKLCVTAYIDHFDDNDDNGNKSFFYGKDNGNPTEKTTTNLKYTVNSTEVTVTNHKSYREMGITASSVDGAALCEVGDAAFIVGDNDITIERMDSYGVNIISIHLVY